MRKSIGGCSWLRRAIVVGGLLLPASIAMSQETRWRCGPAATSRIADGCWAKPADGRSTADGAGDTDRTGAESSGKAQPRPILETGDQRRTVGRCESSSGRRTTAASATDGQRQPSRQPATTTSQTGDQSSTRRRVHVVLGLIIVALIRARRYCLAISWPRPGRCRTTPGNSASCWSRWRRRC